MENVPGKLIDTGQAFYQRGWVLGTSGNFSAVINREPLRLAITASGVDKGTLSIDEILEVDGAGEVTAGLGRPSDETLLHLTVVQQREAGAVLHTHSVWGTLLSEAHANRGGMQITGYEMLKGLAGVYSHEHQEYLPIVENSQDMAALSTAVTSVLRERPDAHAFLIRGHGLYTWGRNLDEAKRHIEILEFLLEVVGRSSPVIGGGN